MRIVFLGTPDFAVESLKALATTKHEIVAVVSQPDRKTVRGVSSMTPVKSVALELGLKVLQYEKIRVEGVEELKELKPDLMVTCAYGQIISQEILDIAPKGVINVHASLLPKFRGSSPIQWAILTGEKKTGITIMKTALEVDSGDILIQKEVEIKDKENAGQLFDRLSLLGAQTLLEAIDLIDKGEDVYTPQDSTKATHYPMLKKEDGHIDWSKSMQEIKCLIYGMTPWPSAFSYLNGKLFKIFDIDTVEDNSQMQIGEILIKDKTMYVKCKDGLIRLNEVQIENKKRMPSSEFIKGYQFKQGDKLN